MCAGGSWAGNDQIYNRTWKRPNTPRSGGIRSWRLLNGEIATVNNWGGGSNVKHLFDRLFLGGSNNYTAPTFAMSAPKTPIKSPSGANRWRAARWNGRSPIIEKARGAIFDDIGFVNLTPGISAKKRSSIPAKPRPVDSTSPKGAHLVRQHRLRLLVLEFDSIYRSAPCVSTTAFPCKSSNQKGSGKFNFNVGYQF